MEPRAKNRWRSGEKILLIDGIHPNEDLGITEDIAQRLRGLGHRVKIVRVPFKDTVHGHSQSGKPPKSFYEHFSGRAFLTKIGFKYPSWHIAGIHASPWEGLHSSTFPDTYHYNTHDAGSTAYLAGHHYLDMSSSKLIPVVYERGRFVPMELMRMSVEIPGEYEKRPSMQIRPEAITEPDANKLAKAYSRKVDPHKTFARESRDALAERAVQSIHDEVMAKRQSRAYYYRQQFESMPLNEIVARNRRSISVPIRSSIEEGKVVYQFKVDIPPVRETIRFALEQARKKGIKID
ncbi:MAG: hypothetical protein V1708_02215 [Candidatus Micrarchaeota archaeon]